MTIDVGFIDDAIAAYKAKYLAAGGPLGVKSMADGNTSIEYQDATEILDEILRLEAIKSRITGERKINVRGRVTGLPGGPTGRDNGY